jgi:hypothetical protein
MTDGRQDIATHAEPAWRDRANFLIFADLSGTGMPGRLEQLWARQLAGDSFELCCIPFFTYGLALGDVVQTTPHGERSYVDNRVTATSGRRVLRVWLAEADAEARAIIERYLDETKALNEWSSENLLAIDVVSHEFSVSLAELRERLAAHGAKLEWGE